MAEAKSSGVGPFGWLAAGIVGLVAFSAFHEPDPAGRQSAGSPAAQNRAMEPEWMAQQRRDDERAEALKKMSRPQQVEVFRAELEALCKLASPNLNFMQAKVRGKAIYCVHSMYSRYSLDAGGLGKVMSDWAGTWASELKAAGINRVGVYGTGEYASGAWFDL